jgi:hypothetical protein
MCFFVYNVWIGCSQEWQASERSSSSNGHPHTPHNMTALDTALDINTLACDVLSNTHIKSSNTHNKRRNTHIKSSNAELCADTQIVQLLAQ